MTKTREKTGQRKGQTTGQTTGQTSDKKTGCRFEEFAEENGMSYWRARWLMTRLGYTQWGAFRKLIHKATSSCMRVDCDILENFRSAPVVHDGREEEDFKLTRFACFLVVQHADTRKPEVEEVRTYLAGLASVVVTGQMLERLDERASLTAGEKTMTSAATRAGLRSDELARFKDAGFRGMYNMSRRRLAEHKGLPADHPIYDHMGIEELAANSFRVTQTAAKLRATGLQGAPVAEHVAHQVGADVRAMMIRNSGSPPEALPLEQDIKQVRKAVKTTRRVFLKQDAKRPGRRRLPTVVSEAQALPESQEGGAQGSGHRAT